MLLVGAHLAAEHGPNLRERARHDAEVAPRPSTFKPRPKRKRSKHTKHAPLQG